MNTAWILLRTFDYAVWWMYDNHTFKRLSSDISTAITEAIECFDSDPYGSLFVRTENQKIIFQLHGYGRTKRDEFIASLEDLRELT